MQNAVLLFLFLFCGRSLAPNHGCPVTAIGQDWLAHPRTHTQAHTHTISLSPFSCSRFLSLYLSFTFFVFLISTHSLSLSLPSFLPFIPLLLSNRITLLFGAQLAKRSFGLEADPAAYAECLYNLRLNAGTNWYHRVQLAAAGVGMRHLSLCVGV